MGKEIIVVVFEVLVLFFIISQILIPCFSSKLPFLWIFKNLKEEINYSKESVKEIAELEKSVEENTEKYKKSLKEIEKTEEVLSQIKNKSKIN